MPEDLVDGWRQAITWTIVDQDQRWHMASLGNNELMQQRCTSIGNIFYYKGQVSGYLS